MPPSRRRLLLMPEPLSAKVPEITLWFWAVKLLTTLAGEVTSDWLGDTNVVLGGIAEVLIIAVALWLQFRVRRYVAATYWLLALAIATVGTGVADTMHTATHLPYVGTSLLWAVILAVVFWRWKRTEGTLSIHSVTTRRREVYYWATVFSTFALGTALGDMTASTLHLGYLDSAWLFLGAFAIPAIAWWRFKLNPVVAFWAAYVLTRPLGASFADWISKPHAITGLGFGDGPTAGLAVLAIVVLVGWLTFSRVDTQPEAAPEPVRQNAG